MTGASLDRFVQEIRKIWGPLDSQLVADCHRLFRGLLRAPAREPWLAELLETLPESKELYRDPEEGFLLLAYSEPPGFYRIPHDHGDGWVIYGVRQGEMKMGTFIDHTDTEGRRFLVQRDRTHMGPRASSVYLPGDIHDTLCTAPSTLVLRLTSRDLKTEQAEGRMIRFIEDGEKIARRRGLQKA